jgi:tagatose-1,6-bisphosphate aldolase
MAYKYVQTKNSTPKTKGATVLTAAQKAKEISFIPGRLVTIYRHQNSERIYHIGRNGSGKLIYWLYGVYEIDDNGKACLDLSQCLSKCVMDEDYFNRLISFGSLVESGSFIIGA